MKLVHYSLHPLAKGNLMRPESNRISTKPRGIWLSIDDEWKRWCERNNHKLERLANPHRVVLSASARMVVVDDEPKFRSFSRQYGVRGSDGRVLKIKWDLLGIGADGIIISPYMSTQRRYPWYDLWNCACACVWNIGVIEEIGDG